MVVVDARADGGSRVGYVVVLLGVVGFVVGSFLPYFGGAFLPPPEGAISLYRLISGGPGTTFEHLGGVLSLFAGAAIVGAIALWGVIRPRTWTPPALVAGAAAWTLTWIGVLISQGTFGPHEVGYWVLLASLSVAIAGTIVVVLVTVRTRGRAPTQNAPLVDVAGPETIT
jgi:hypothetical protein